jgi:hypothetical protein
MSAGTGNFLSEAWHGTPAKQTGFVQNFGPQRQSAFNQFAQNPGQFDLSQNPLYKQITDLISKSPYMQQFDPKQGNEYFDQGVANPAWKMYNEQVLPGIKQQYYNASGVYGSALNGAINQSSQNLQQGLGQLRSNYLQQGEQQHRQGQLQSIAQSLGLAQAPAQQNLQYYNQLFGTNSESPMIEEAQSGWFQDLLKLIAQAVGGGSNSYFQTINQPGK